MHLLLLAGMTLFPAPAPVQDRCGEREPAPGLLVSAEWLKRHHSDDGLVLLQVERSRAPYDSGHVAGARFIAMGDFTTRRGDLLTELPPVEHLDSVLESLGIGDRSRVVLYGEILPVTRLFFTLDYLGLGARVSVLDGGLTAWRTAGGSVTTVPAPESGRGTLTLHPHAELLADWTWVNAHRQDPGVSLLDARSPDEFEGKLTEDGVARPGHIPGAANLDWTTTVTGGHFRGGAELKQLFTAAGATAGKEVVTYCRVGTRASELYFAARLLGFRVRLYDGSMNEWAARTDLPMTLGPKP
jgi:thiosulfate/3-mercaptopyruvate sulfurtransferase